MDKSPTAAASSQTQGSPTATKTRPLLVRILRRAGYVLLLVLGSYILIKPN
jgi:hypothetical protein